MAAMIADEAGERELVGPDEGHAEKPGRRLAERPLPIA